jgi:hypothetical protein
MYVSDRICRENEDTDFIFNSIFPKTVPFRDNVEKYCTAGQATHDDIIRVHRMRIAC